MAKGETTTTLPPKWTDDPLSEFANHAFRNMLATFVRKSPQFNVLVELDRYYFNIASNLVNPTDILAPLFLMRSHSAYRAGCQLACGGQIVESFCVLRSCLEFALYGLHIYINESLGEVWLQRHDDADSLRTVKKEFTHVKVINTLRNEDRQLFESVELLYKRTIDFGGHPNERAITGSMLMESSDAQILLQQIYLHADDLSLDHGMKTAAQVGLRSLYILRRIFRERFDILDITSGLDRLSKQL